MTEAHYIEGKYAYLDGLKAKFPHLTIGGCAGGGRETDIESYRRTQMNSRADGYCAGDQLCSQGETYALSLWLPRHGQSQSTMDGLAVDPVTGAALPRGASDTDYSFHSFMSMSMAFEYDWGGDTPGGWGKFRGWLKKFTGVRDLYDGDFYPLLPYSLSHFDCARTPSPFVFAFHVISMLVACRDGLAIPPRGSRKGHDPAVPPRQQLPPLDHRPPLRPPALHKLHADRLGGGSDGGDERVGIAGWAGGCVAGGAGGVLGGECDAQGLDPECVRLVHGHRVPGRVSLRCACLCSGVWMRGWSSPEDIPLICDSTHRQLHFHNVHVHTAHLDNSLVLPPHIDIA